MKTEKEVRAELERWRKPIRMRDSKGTGYEVTKEERRAVAGILEWVLV